MTKSVRKSIITTILTLCLAAVIGLFVACGTNPDTPPADESVTYTVTVKTDDSQPASGVSVSVKKGGATIGSAQTTDANGTVTFSLPADEYEIALANLPAHYSVPADANLKLTYASNSLTVTLERAFAYAIKLVTPDGNPFYDATVSAGICTLSGNCLAPVALETSGIAYCEPSQGYDGDYKIHVLGLENYIYECDEEGYYSGAHFTDDVTEITVTLYPATTMLSGDALTDEEKRAYTASHSGYSSEMYDYPAYLYDVKLDEDDVKYFTITPSISGLYYFYCNDSNAYYYFDGNEFSTEITGVNQTLTYSHYETLTAGKTYYIKAVATNGDADTKLLVTAPVGSYIEVNNLAGKVTQSLTVSSANTNAVIAVKTNSPAAYSLTAQGATLCKITTTFSTPAVYTDPTDAADYTAKNTLSAKITESQIYYTLYFVVQVKADKYPATVAVELEKIADVPNVTTTVTVKETLAQQTAPEGSELVPVPMDSTTELVYNETDKTYHLGTVDGPQVVVNLTATNPSRHDLGVALAYIDSDYYLSNAIKYVTTESVDSVTSGDKVTDYREFLRGFIEFDWVYEGRNPVAKVPETLTQQNCYAAFVDENGCYPLTQELKDFLELFYELNETILYYNISGGEDDYLWLFPCYYYAAEVEADPIVGIYKSDDGAYVLTIDKFGNFTVTCDGDEIDNGTWTVNDGTYSFVCRDSTLSYNANSAEFTYVDTFYENNPLDITLTLFVEDPICGTYETAEGDFSLIIDSDGTFILYENSFMGQDVFDNGTWVKNGDAYTFYCFDDMEYGDELTYSNGTFTFTDDSDMNLTLTRVDE